MKTNRPRTLHRLLGALILAVSFGVAWLWMDYRSFIETPLPLPAQGSVVTLPPGTPLGVFAQELAADGYLQDPLYFRWLARWRDDARRVRAGEYRLQPGLTPPLLLDLLVSGQVIQHTLTLVEGWTFRQALQAVHAHPALKQTLPGADEAEIMARLDAPDTHPEGWFYPDTYHFPKGTSDLEFLRRAKERMQEVLQAAWEDRQEGLPLKSPYEALILASIVEKETGLGSERADIAGVFIRRLRKGMRLQTDPTVIYGLGDRFDGNLRRADLREDTAYNTYVHSGLPPTPICLPGGAAIHAAVNPADGEALYFVARGDGSHEFSATLEQHNRAVRKFQLKK